MSCKVLITGGTGYLGGRIAANLAVENKFLLRVTVPPGADKQRPPLPGNEIVVMDLSNDQQIHEACQGVDCIIHLAAMNEIECAADPEGALTVNGLGTLKLIRKAEAFGVKRLIYMSTAHVYGSPLVGTLTEASLPRPVHPYAITHRVAEDFVFSAVSHRSLEGIVIRLSNALGSPLHSQVNRWSLVANDLCRQVVCTGKIKLNSSGVQQRDFISITDVCAAIRHFIELPVNQSGDGLFNLGGDKSISIIELAETISERSQAIWGFKPSINRPSVEPEEKVGLGLNYSMEKLKSTGFELKGSIQDAIDETLLFCANHFKETI